MAGFIVIHGPTTQIVSVFVTFVTCGVDLETLSIPAIVIQMAAQSYLGYHVLRLPIMESQIIHTSNISLIYS